MAKTTVTILIVGFSLYFSIWKVDFSELGQSFKTANYLIALSIIPIIVLSHLVRAHRWKVMLASIHPEIRISTLFVGVIVGYFMNNIIPRSGELARPYVTAEQSKESGATFSGLLGTIIVERFIDTVALLLVIAAVLLIDTSLFAGLASFETAVKNLVYPTIILGVMFLIIAPSAVGLKIAGFISRPFPERIRTKLLEVFVKLQKGFGALRNARQIVLVVGETALMYALYMAPLFIMFFAVDSGRAASPSILDAVKVFAITALAYAVAPTPGAFGVFHVTARVATMQLLQFSYADAVAYATIMHFINYSTVMVIGAYYLLTQNLSLKAMLRPGASNASAV